MDTQTSRDALARGEDGALQQQPPPTTRRQSSSQESEDSQTAADFLRSQMQLEADAREALPYSIENCTKPLGRLRQSVFACLTCNPPPEDAEKAYERYAGVCYACSVQCHGEHTLVEIFNKRNFTCDCGTTRFPDSSPCSLRVNPQTNTKGNVHSEAPDAGNKYNHNFRNRFCACACDYDPFEQKVTMFQCLGLGTTETGGCGEDWYHPGCMVGLGPKGWEEAAAATKTSANGANADPLLPTIAEDAEGAPNAHENDAVADDAADDAEDEDLPLPLGFPKEEEFEGFICYKCVEAYPWIKRYAGTPGFLPAVFLKEEAEDGASAVEEEKGEPAAPGAVTTSRKRKSEDAEVGCPLDQDVKRQRNGDDASKEAQGVSAEGESKEAKAEAGSSTEACKLLSFPKETPAGRFSLFFTESFRDSFCRCADCFPLLQPHAQLLEEEETYEPPVSEDGSDVEGNANGGSGGGRSHGSGSLYDRGESALRNVDRVRAIEGVMAYNHLKDKLKPFFQQFAESGQAISAEDIKAYFAKLRGDDQAIQDAGDAAKSADVRREQSGY